MASAPRPPREFDPDATVDARTHSYTQASPAPAAQKRRGTTGLLDHASEHHSDETRAPLRVRLRAAALVILFRFTVFLVWSLSPFFDPEVPNALIRPMHILTVIVLGLCAFWLRRP